MPAFDGERPTLPPIRDLFHDVPPIRSGSIPRPTSPEDPTPVARFDRRPYEHSGHKPAQRHAAWPGEISTLETSTRGAEDERTPVARYNDPSSRRMRSVSRDDEDRRSGVSASKYECSYCGKGFNRPSSLKIHLNSHTGAKPFVCPVESCGRSFSVLSNMRRHARVHTQVPLHTDPSSDDESELSSSYTGSAPPSATLSTHSRRSSIVSVSSTGSRRSHASSDDSTTLNVSRPEKRFRIDAN
ncbi:hypothetical protein H0H93_005808 [Arthromyces matolae]|nr:hypothetical protein H0H93_005808 [Arthromyces matolae]